MTRSVLATLTLLVPVLFACSKPIDETALRDEARRVASGVPPRLLGVLQEEIGKGGFDGAIAACRDFAPRLAAEASAETGWAIRRVSLRNRNPKAVPDAWERAALEAFDQRAGAGEVPAAIETSAIVGSGSTREFRYMKALPTQELCLACHGLPENIDPAVRARLEELYPQDQATGYRVGEIRGAMTLRKAL
jgi:hypothetical protein